MGSRMQFRTATVDDAPILAALSIEVWIGTYLPRGVNAFFARFALEEFTAARLARAIEDPSQHFIVSENADGLDGFIRISHGSDAPMDGGTDTGIATLYVQPRHQGRGLGRALLDQALAHAREAGAPSVWLTVNSDNRGAIAFYLAQGFKDVGTTHFHIGDQAYLNQVLQRPL